MRMSRRSAAAFVVAVAVVAGVAGAAGGCAPAPRVRPVKAGPTDTGPGSLEYVRAQLEGSWELVRLEVIGPNGAATPVEAAAKLTYDRYGNLSVVGDVTDAKAREAMAGRPMLLNLTGRAVIDTSKQLIRILDVESDREVEAARTTLDAASLARARYYEFEADVLKLTVKDQAGNPTARLTWKKMP